MRIGLLAEATGVPAKTLRYWEAEGLLHDPDRTPGGYRDYPPGTAERVAFIRQAQGAGLTLRQIREIIAVREAGRAPCEHTAVWSIGGWTRSSSACASCPKPAPHCVSCAAA